MRRLVEEAEKETAAQYHHLQKNDTHAAYTHTSTPRFKKSKKANHPHSPQKVEPAKEKLTIKQARNSQPNSLKLPKGPEIRPRSKGDSEHTERKTTVVHIKKGPRPEDEAMAQGLQNHQHLQIKGTLCCKLSILKVVRMHISGVETRAK
ncbi:hypothetical protein YC2023_076239 [Brassica napus]